MNIQEKYSQELKKIFFINSINKKAFRFSNILLFREYQSRLFSWKRALGNNNLDFFNKKKSFHNLFLDMKVKWENEIISEEKVVNDLKKNGFLNLNQSFRDYESFFLTMFINWEVFKDRIEMDLQSELPPPYEPTFKIFSRGGAIYHSEGKFEIDINGQTYRKYDKEFKLPSLDEDFLNYIDNNCDDFPNQEKVNLLWDFYNSK
ncbi:hypothetical protein [Pedobacter sp. R-06]|uniref:hypothetical protein n=1 Tax=Pedobacter sp. R-06 TaxID=3404051 RepID=UPI003CF7EA38